MQKIELTAIIFLLIATTIVAKPHEPRKFVASTSKAPPVKSATGAKSVAVSNQERVDADKALLSAERQLKSAAAQVGEAYKRASAKPREKIMEAGASGALQEVPRQIAHHASQLALEARKVAGQAADRKSNNMSPGDPLAALAGCQQDIIWAMDSLEALRLHLAVVSDTGLSAFMVKFKKSPEEIEQDVKKINNDLDAWDEEEEKAAKKVEETKAEAKEAEAEAKEAKEKVEKADEEEVEQVKAKEEASVADMKASKAKAKHEAAKADHAAVKKVVEEKKEEKAAKKDLGEAHEDHEGAHEKLESAKDEMTEAHQEHGEAKEEHAEAKEKDKKAEVKEAKAEVQEKKAAVEEAKEEVEEHEVKVEKHEAKVEKHEAKAEEEEQETEMAEQRLAKMRGGHPETGHKDPTFAGAPRCVPLGLLVTLLYLW